MLAIVVAFGSHGDVLPLIAIGAELRRRGDEVLFVSAEPFRALAVRAGLDFEPLVTTEEFEAAVAAADLWLPIRGVRRLFAYAEHGIRPALEIVRRRRVKGDTIVVASTLAFGARLAGDALRIPVVTVHMSPMLVDSRFEAPRLPGVPSINWLPSRLKRNFQLGVDRHVIDPALTPRLNELRAELGLPPIQRLRHWWNSPRRVLLMCPDWYARPQADWPMQLRQCGFPRSDVYGHTGEGLDESTERFLDDGDAAVAITFGTALRDGAELYRRAIDATMRAGRRALVMTPIALGLGAEHARRVHVTSFAPISRVAPRCAAILHHGGIGTLAHAFAAGVPQVIAPLAFDQFDNGERVKRLGCGVVVGRGPFKRARIAAAVREATASEAIAQACRRVARFPIADGVMLACDEIQAELRAARGRKRLRVRDGALGQSA